MKETERSITWLQFNNIVPIITSAVIIAFSWASLGTQIALLNQKVDYLVKTQEEYLQRNKDVQVRLGVLEIKTSNIETMLKIK